MSEGHKFHLRYIMSIDIYKMDSISKEKHIKSNEKNLWMDIMSFSLENRYAFLDLMDLMCNFLKYFYSLHRKNTLCHTNGQLFNILKYFCTQKLEHGSGSSQEKNCVPISSFCGIMSIFTFYRFKRLFIFWNVWT